MQKDKVLNLIGLAQKAGKVVSGEFMTEKAVKTGEAALVILAEDASENTQKKFRNMCEFYKVPLRIHAAKDYLGHAMGKELRASLAVVDNGFAQAIMKKMD